MHRRPLSWPALRGPARAMSRIRLTHHPHDRWTTYLLSPEEHAKLDHHIVGNKDEMLRMYTQMATIRRMEMTLDQLYKNKMIRGFCHLSIGQVRARTRTAGQPPGARAA